MTRETVPGNHLLAMLNDRQKAKAAAAELEQHGFEEPIVMTHDVEDRLQEESGFLARALKNLWGQHLSEEPDYLDQYEEAARQGRTVIAVKAAGDDEVKLAQSILEKHGAVNLRFFGRLAVSDLTPDTNPSATSDEPPAPRPVERS